MSDRTEEVARAEAEADRLPAAEALAEQRFQAVQAVARASGKPDEALPSPEFKEWMAARHATDAAWGAWAVVMDTKPGS